MSKSTFTILFYARKNQVNRMGKAGIMIRVTVNGESVQFSSKLDIEPELWDAMNQKMLGAADILLSVEEVRHIDDALAAMPMSEVFGGSKLKELRQ